MIFPRAGMKTAAPAIVKKLTQVITVPEMVTGKRSFGMGVDQHPKGIEETHEKENEAIP